MIMADKAQVRQPAPLAEILVDLVEGGSAGGGAVLRVQRQNQKPVHAFAEQSINALAYRRLAIAHGKSHFHLLTKTLLQLLAQCISLVSRVIKQR